MGIERGHRNVIQLKVSILSFKISAIWLHLYHTERANDDPNRNANLILAPYTCSIFKIIKENCLKLQKNQT